jgi:hypothetical protein
MIHDSIRGAPELDEVEPIPEYQTSLGHTHGNTKEMYW